MPGKKRKNEAVSNKKRLKMGKGKRRKGKGESDFFFFVNIWHTFVNCILT